MCRCSIRPHQYVYVGFSRHKIPRSLAYTIAEKAIRFRHSDYNLDRAQKLISSSMSRRLSTCSILFKSMHAFLSNLANRQTDKRRQTHLPPYHLRSAARGDLAVPRARTMTYGQRSFSVSGQSLWNSLPLSVSDPSLTMTQFCTHLKTFLFRRAYCT